MRLLYWMNGYLPWRSLGLFFFALFNSLITYMVADLVPVTENIIENKEHTLLSLQNLFSTL